VGDPPRAACVKNGLSFNHSAKKEVGQTGPFESVSG
jgi:hypothetical protein